MWDNREGKRNPKAPDFKCKDRSCDGVIWPPRATTAGTTQAAASRTSSTSQPPTVAAAPTTTAGRGAPAAGPRVDANGMPLCPICGGAMWDDRESKRNPRAPDFKCRNKPRERGGPGCEGVIWPARDGSPSPYPPPLPRRTASSPTNDAPPAWDGPPLNDDDIPF